MREPGPEGGSRCKLTTARGVRAAAGAAALLEGVRLGRSVWGGRPEGTDAARAHGTRQGLSPDAVAIVWAWDACGWEERQGPKRKGALLKGRRSTPKQLFATEPLTTEPHH